MTIKIYIPSDIEFPLEKKSLFILVRPFYRYNGWSQFGDTFKKWKLNPDKLKLVNDLQVADVMLIPYPINYYYDMNQINIIKHYNSLCEKYKLKAFGYIAGDYGMKYPEFKYITYYRLGGNKSNLSNKNKGLPAALSDQNKTLFGTDGIDYRKKKSKPVIGFCGHATSNRLIYFHQTFKYLSENLNRFLNDTTRIDYEPFFQSAFHRHRLLKIIQGSKNIITKFIFRGKYRAGAKSKEEYYSSTLEYYNNIKESDYILCIRGAGNFSIRFYETLMMGRIPIFINTDCILPLEEHINWKDHVVWIEWEQISRINEIIYEFHKNIEPEQFVALQAKNRKLWKSKLQPKFMIQTLI